MSRYAEFYNRAGMLTDRAKAALLSLPAAERNAITDEHNRRTEAIAEAWAEKGEVIDYHDPRFALPQQVAPADEDAKYLRGLKGAVQSNGGMVNSDTERLEQIANRLEHIASRLKGGEDGLREADK